MDLMIKKDLRLTSREIAELTGKRHDNVIRDIRVEKEKLDSEGISTVLIFEESHYTNSQGKEQPQYSLSKDGVMMLAMKYDTITRYKITQKLNELENNKVPTTFKEALLLAVAQQEEIEKLELENKEKELIIIEQKPKADYFDALVDANLLVSFRDTAKELNIKERLFISFLIARKYIYRDGSNKLKPVSKYVGELFELKEYIKGEFKDVQTMINPKGREVFRLLIGVNTIKEISY